MTSHSTAPVTKADIEEYLRTSSDFAFELRVLEQLTQAGFTCRHGGTYVDPVTGKDRSFDIRATWIQEASRLQLAVECKNLRPDYPLLVHCSKRTRDEAFHHVALAVDSTRFELPVSAFVKPRPTCKILDRTGANSLYPEDGYVGKSCAQVPKNNGTKKPSDSDIYDKWSQSLSSAHDLVVSATAAAPSSSTPVVLTIVLPILVVPDNRLWLVGYGADGHTTIAPEQVDRCPYLVNKPYPVSATLGNASMTLSHVDFVTQSGLQKLIDEVRTPDNHRKYFACDDTSSHIRRVAR